MSDPALVRVGNARLAGLATAGWPDDPLALAAAVRGLLEGAAGDPPPAIDGPAMVWVSGDPGELPPARWDALTGWFITGLPAPGLATGDGQRLLVEDYRQLTAYALAHQGPVRDLVHTHRRLAEAARSAGRRLRPYWRVLLRARALADGNLLPGAEVQVFLDG